MAKASNSEPKGRGSHIRPRNRFQNVHLEDDLEHLAYDEEPSSDANRTEFIFDESTSIISENDSPDIPFRYSLNPYRGCSHGCAYCYARPTHEYLGLDAGLDFESKILVKRKAPELLRDWLCRDAWQPEMIAISGVTDCYQPCEREFRLTRGCLEVALEAKQPIGMVTKNALVVRDLDLLQPMAEAGVISVSLSITTLDKELARTMEPRTSTPAARLRAIEQLSQAGVPVSVMTSPIIPGLNDHEMPAILQAAADAGAQSASYILLRLPLTVKPVFLEWLKRTQPAKVDKVISRIEGTRDGQLSSSQFGERMRGNGLLADQIASTFQVFSRKYGLAKRLPELRTDQFRPPRRSDGQLSLF